MSDPHYKSVVLLDHDVIGQLVEELTVKWREEFKHVEHCAFLRAGLKKFHRTHIDNHQLLCKLSEHGDLMVFQHFEVEVVRGEVMVAASFYEINESNKFEPSVEALIEDYNRKRVPASPVIQ